MALHSDFGPGANIKQALILDWVENSRIGCQRQANRSKSTSMRSICRRG